jgi:hypothetical protein
MWRGCYSRYLSIPNQDVRDGTLGGSHYPAKGSAKGPKIRLAFRKRPCYSSSVQQPPIREIGLPNLLWLLRRIEMPTKRAVPAKASRKAAVVDDDEDEEEVVVVSSKKKTAAPAAKSNGKTNGAVRKVAKADAEEGTYTPNANSMRDFIMRAMRRGGTSAEIKKRAASFASKKGVEDLSDVKAYKNFDVAFYAKFLKSKGFSVDIDEDADSYTLSA